MRLAWDWKLILKRSWSLRFNMLATLLGAGAALYYLYLGDSPPLIQSLIFLGLSLAAGVSRVIFQKDL